MKEAYGKVIKLLVPLSEIDTFSGREVSLSNLFCLPSEKEPTLNGKNLLPMGASSFFLELVPFQKGVDVQQANRKTQKLFLL